MTSSRSPPLTVGTRHTGSRRRELRATGDGGRGWPQTGDTGCVIARAPHLQLDGRGPVLLDGGMSNALEERPRPVGLALDGTAPPRRPRGDRGGAPDLLRVRRQGRHRRDLPGYVTGFVEAGMESAEAEELIRLGVRLARDARDACSGDGTLRWVAASVGPYGAVLADGSEYRAATASRVPRSAISTSHGWSCSRRPPRLLRRGDDSGHPRSRGPRAAPGRGGGSGVVLLLVMAC